MFFLKVLPFLFLISCTLTSIDPSGGADMEIDLTTIDMRHGWAVFTMPKRTVIGVNDKASIDRGSQLFQKYCTRCHGKDGRGSGTFAKEKGLKPANLRNLSREVSNTYLVIQINDGKGAMPKWQDFLTSQQLWDLTNYIQTFKD